MDGGSGHPSTLEAPRAHQLVRMSAVLSIAGAEVPTRLTGIGRASLIRRIDAWTGPRHSSVVLLATGWPGDVDELASDLAGCVAQGS